MSPARNVDHAVVEGFGDEWTRFDQSDLPGEERRALFESYFSVFPWSRLPQDAVGFDLGCGSGRWAMEAAPKVGVLHCIDPSNAIAVARRNLAHLSNCVFHQSDVDALPFEDGSMDFGYSLGVLHHIPDTAQAMRKCVEKLRPGAPFLVYLYYSFENRPKWFRGVWQLSELARRLVSKSPMPIRYAVSQIFAGAVYFPLARFAAIAERAGANVANFPLSVYRNSSFYTMRTDALDRFGTRLEQRFSRAEIRSMMERAGLTNIVFSEHEPYWCAVGVRQPATSDMA